MWEARQGRAKALAQECKRRGALAVVCLGLLLLLCMFLAELGKRELHSSQQHVAALLFTLV